MSNIHTPVKHDMENRAHTFKEHYFIHWMTLVEVSAYHKSL
jgi:hypothetical protein